MFNSSPWCKFGRSLAMIFLLSWAWLLVPDSAWGKPPKQAEAPPQKSYSLPYALVVLGVILGVVVVTRPSNRLNEPKVPVPGKENV